MFIIDNADIIAEHDDFIDVFMHGSTDTVFGLDYMGNAFPKLEKRAQDKLLADIHKKNKDATTIYPYIVNIPRPLKEMLDTGDFTPLRSFTVEKPFKGPVSDIWFGSTLDGISLRCGYVNGDSRKIDQHALNDSTVHGFIAGATGQGKSVTMNSIIYCACAEYAPWELTMTLSDAKIVEFKSIAQKHPMPQIDIIAATSDTDYLLSMLLMKWQEMMMRQQLFTKAAEAFGKEVKNIKQFRKVTGLSLPRNLLLFDECTAMFQNAGKRVNKIVEVLDSIARLGRNAGFHLLMDSQEVSSSIPNETLANLTFRGAMGCTGEVSTKVIGNAAASDNMGKKGRLIINTKRAEKNEAANILIQVPFFADDQLGTVSESAIKLGKETKTTPVLRFYDETEKLYLDRYIEFINQFKPDHNRILLGPPSFIMDGKEQVVSINLSKDNVDNICVFVNKSTSKQRALWMLRENFKRVGGQHFILNVDPFLQRVGKLEELKPLGVFEDRNYTTSAFFNAARSVIYKRMMMVYADKRVFTNPTTSQDTDKYFYTKFEHGSEFDTYTNRCRFKEYLAMMQSDPEILAGFVMQPEGEFERKLKLAVNALKFTKNIGCMNTQVTPDKFENAWFWFLGMERFLGIGRDSKGRNVDNLKALLQDCSGVNVRFIIFTTSLDETAAIKESIGYYLSDDLTSKQVMSIKAADDWPEQLSSVLMVLYNPKVQGVLELSEEDKKKEMQMVSNNFSENSEIGDDDSEVSVKESLKIQKFKKLMLKGEM